MSDKENLKVFTWNFGKFSKEKVDCIITKIDLSKNDPIVYYAIGLQEITTSEIENIIISFNNAINNYNTNKTKKYKLIYESNTSGILGKNMSSIFSFTNAGFDLLTIYIIPDDPTFELLTLHP
jgi:hypothetical protein